VAHGDEPLLPRMQESARARESGANDHDVEDVFEEPGEVAEIDSFDARDVLAERWPDPEYGRDRYLTAELEPFTGRFPGLAPGIAHRLPEEAIIAALDQFEAVYIGLVEAGRAADVITVTGWAPTDAWQEREPLSSVLRSWEDRFGARLIQVGPSAEIRLLVERPPRTQTEALPVAAELYAFGETFFAEAHNNHGNLKGIGEIAARLVNGPVWGFWWD
jgi:Domain of unknown function (DUF4253)